MTRTTLYRLDEIARIRAVQCSAAEAAAGIAAQDAERRVEERRPLDEAVGFAAQGYRESLEQGGFDAALTENWHRQVADRLQRLSGHDQLIDAARTEAASSAEHWHRSSGLLALAEAARRQAQRHSARRRDEAAMADAADLRSARTEQP